MIKNMLLLIIITMLIVRIREKLTTIDHYQRLNKLVELLPYTIYVYLYSYTYIAKLMLNRSKRK